VLTDIRALADQFLIAFPNINNWVEQGERRYYDIDFVNEAEQQVHTIQQYLEAAQARQKSYADKRRKPIDFAVGDHVYLKGVSNEGCTKV